MQTRMRCALLALLLSACSSDDGRRELSAPTPPTTVADHMQDHFVRVLQVRDAIILGRLDDAREPATWLAEHGAPPEAPQGWIPYITELRKFAGVVADAEDLAELARATGDMSRSCGRCHEALGAKINFAYGPPPPNEPGAAARMLRHDWAVDRLWEGIVIPSGKAWAAGAEVLTGAPLAPTEVSGDGPIDPKLADLVNQVHRLGARATAEKEPTARGMLFGQLLETCTACHRIVGVPHPTLGESPAPK